jgi:hypothetical protein
LPDSSIKRGRGLALLLGHPAGEPGRRQVVAAGFFGGVDGQPHHALAGEFFLQALHVAAVVFAHKGAAGVGPFQHHQLAFVVAQAVGFAGGVDGGKVGRRLADGGRCGLRGKRGKRGRGQPGRGGQGAGKMPACQRKSEEAGVRFDMA